MGGTSGRPYLPTGSLSANWMGKIALTLMLTVALRKDRRLPGRKMLSHVHQPFCAGSMVDAHFPLRLVPHRPRCLLLRALARCMHGRVGAVRGEGQARPWPWELLGGRQPRPSGTVSRSSGGRGDGRTVVVTRHEPSRSGLGVSLAHSGLSWGRSTRPWSWHRWTKISVCSLTH